MNKYKIGFIGYGKMARAISEYLITSDLVSEIVASDPYTPSDTASKVKLINDNNLVVRSSDIVFLAIKPQLAQTALDGIDFSGKIVISIMAGIKINKLTELAVGATKIVRVMPNLCAQIGKSVNAYSYIGLNASEALSVVQILNSFGTSYHQLKEADFDAFTGLVGSSPAYIFRFLKNIIEVGTEYDFDFETAKGLVLETAIGCAELLKQKSSLNDMGQLIENVCSKGGTTIEGIYKLDDGNFDNTVKSAIVAAITRSEELSK